MCQFQKHLMPRLHLENQQESEFDLPYHGLISVKPKSGQAYHCLLKHNLLPHPRLL
jgi:hypothetical protein